VKSMPHLTTHSTGAEVTCLSFDSLDASLNVPRPVNSGVGPLRIKQRVELNVT